MNTPINSRFLSIITSGILATFLSMNSSAVELIAHRGYSAIAPENTLASFREAWKTDAEAIELDIHLTGDKKIIVSHDSNTRRTSGKDYDIKSTSSKILRTLDVGSFKGEQFKGEKLPLLEEVLKEAPKDKKIFVEIKASDNKMLPYLKRILNKSDKKSQVVIICFNQDILGKAKEMMPAFPAYWLHSSSRDTITNTQIKYDMMPIQIALDKKLDGLDSYFEGVTPEFVKAVHDAGLKLYIWTCDDPQKAVKAATDGVDGITTNNPVLLRDALNKAGY